MPTVSVLICTYRRTERLALLLGDIAAQTRPPDEVVVVDNHDVGSARQTVADFAARAAFAVRYDVQPEKNISLTRNRTVELAQGDWLAFIDDDERAPPAWLETMLGTAQRYSADGVLGPALCIPPPEAPAWVRDGNLYPVHRAVTGTPVRRESMWINNALLGAAHVRAEPGPFDEGFGLTGGEDNDMLARLAARGMRIVWCDEAQVVEPVEPARLKARWILARAMRGGQSYAILWRLGRYAAARPGPVAVAVFMARAFAQMLVALLLALLTLAAGRHRAMGWLGKAASNAGKLTTMFGWHYREYAAPVADRAP